jgi:hypothetical protein
VGYNIEQRDVVQATPPSLWAHACRFLASKLRGLREEACKKIEKWQKPRPACQAT